MQLRQYLSILRKWLWLLVLCTVLGGTAAYAISLRLPLIYRASAVLLISEDLDEILMIADRVAVIYEGRISPSIPVEEARIDELGLMMTGSTAVASDSRDEPAPRT